MNIERFTQNAQAGDYGLPEYRGFRGSSDACTESTCIWLFCMQTGRTDSEAAEIHGGRPASCHCGPCRRRWRSCLRSPAARDNIYASRRLNPRYLMNAEKNADELQGRVCQRRAHLPGAAQTRGARRRQRYSPSITLRQEQVPRSAVQRSEAIRE